MRHPLRRRVDERGAVAVMTALLLSSVLLVVAGLAVDLGMGRVGRRDMQAVADTVALDLARLLDGRTRSQIEAGSSIQPSLTNALSASVQRNDAHALGDGITVTPYLVTVDKTGSYPSVGGVPTQVASTVSPNAVVVMAKTHVSFVFGSAVGVSPTRQAVANASSTACFRLGSYAARLDSSTSPLLNLLINKMLGGSINLDAVSYQGLAAANISLLGLAAKLGLGTVDQLLTTSLSANKVLLAAVDVLKQNGDTANANILNTIAVGVGALPIKLGSLVNVAPGSGAAETATLDVLDLVTGAAYVANGSNAISVPSLGTNLGLTGTSLTTALSIISKPSTACPAKVDPAASDSVASTSQVHLSISGKVASLPALTGLTLTVGNTNVTVDVAPATGTLTSVTCGNETTANPSGEDVQVKSGLASASVSTTVSIGGTVTSGGLLGTLLGGLGTLLNSVLSIQIQGSLTLSAGTAQPSTTKTAQIRVPVSPTSWDKAVSTGSGDLGVNTLSVVPTWTTGPTIVAKGLLGTITLNASQIAQVVSNLVSSLVSGLLDPVVTSLNSTVLSPLFHMLGLEIGGADVFGQRPSCNRPALIR